MQFTYPCEAPTLFLRGANSRYVLDEDIPRIYDCFTQAIVQTIPDAGHWVHVDQPAALAQKVKDFLWD
jgi:esterase